MVPAPRVCAEAMRVGCGIPITAKMRVLDLADRISARCRVDGGAAASAGVVVSEADIESASVLKMAMIRLCGCFSILCSLSLFFFRFL
jgi:hypothetical protein